MSEPKGKSWLSRAGFGLAVRSDSDIGSKSTAGDSAVKLANPGWCSSAHAAALLDGLQRCGQMGIVPAYRVMEAYSALCAERGWQVLPWMAVARRFRPLCLSKGPRTIVENGRATRLVAYDVPAIGVTPPGDAPSRSLVARVARLERQLEILEHRSRAA